MGNRLAHSPTPSNLFDWESPGKLRAWKAADATSEIVGDTKEFAALDQHLAGLSFKADFDGFCQMLNQYENAAQVGLGHSEQLVKEKVSIEVEGWTPVRFFNQATARARITSNRYRGTASEAMDELDHWAKLLPEARHPNGDMLVASEGAGLEPGRIKPENWLNRDISVFHGYSRIATVSSYDDATEAVRTLAKLAKLLPEEEPITAVVDAYYDLVEQRERLSQNLAPVVVGKWLEDGHCEWCPSGR